MHLKIKIVTTNKHTNNKHIFHDSCHVNIISHNVDLNNTLFGQTPLFNVLPYLHKRIKQSYIKKFSIKVYKRKAILI